jgi:hypothetical protein
MNPPIYSSGFHKKGVAARATPTQTGGVMTEEVSYDNIMPLRKVVVALQQ